MTIASSGRRLVLGGLIAGCTLAPPAAHSAHLRARPSAGANGNANTAELPLIVVDPGHGGRDPGAIGVTGTLEKTVTLATAFELKRQLEATRRYRVLLTRTHDQTLDLPDRVAYVREHGATVLISLHADAAPNRRAHGASVYIQSALSPARRVPAHPGDIARALADEPDPTPSAAGWLRRGIIRALSDDIDLTPAPSREARLYVLGSGVPSVLVEMGFLSNREDEAALKRPAHRRVIAAAVREAVDAYFARVRHTPVKQT